jgi:hypothetical protein
MGAAHTLNDASGAPLIPSCTQYSESVLKRPERRREWSGIASATSFPTADGA